jgi:TonB family protein
MQQKCFVASTGFHLLLVLILLVGPAFLSSKSKSDNSPILDVIPGKLIDEAFSGSGNPLAKPPPPDIPAPPKPRVSQPPPPPEPTHVRPPGPAPEPEKDILPTKPDPFAVEPAKDHKPRKPEVNTTLVTHKPNTVKPVKPSATNSTADSEERRLADARKRAADLIGATARNLRNDVSPGVSIDTRGNATGGEAYANYDQAVQSIYWHEWTPPEDTASDAAITKATVTIASDGTVLSAHILNPSGDSSVDKSVQRTLDHVRYIAPFPEGAKEKQRTYKINFNLKAKRLTG